MNARVAQSAARQWGVVDLDDLRGCGLSDRAIAWRVDTGHLLRVYRGVFAVGYLPLSLEGRFLAAVKACGPGAALSHWSAVVHWRLRQWIEHDPHVTSPALRRQPGIVHHRAEQFKRTIHRGISVTAPARTICDIAATAAYKVLRSVVNHAFGLGLVTPMQLISYTGRGAK